MSQDYAYWKGRAVRAEKATLALVSLVECVVAVNDQTMPLHKRRQAIRDAIGHTYPPEVVRVRDRALGGDNQEHAEQLDRLQVIN
jgi:hypothetical protein